MIDTEKAQPTTTESKKGKPEPKKRKLRSFTEVFGDGEFYPDVEKVDFKTILDMELVMEDAKILKDFNTEFGKHDAALMLMSNPEDEQQLFTTICSGQVVVERVEKALKQRALPLMCVPVEVTSGRNKYYNLK